MSEFVTHSLPFNVSGSVTAISATSADLPLNNEFSSDESGSRFVRSRSLAAQAPVMSFSTEEIGGFFDIVSPLGTCINATGTLRSAGRILEQRSDCPGEVIASNAHISNLIAYGIVLPEEISFTRNKTASLSGKVHAVADPTGANHPVAISESATLPASVLAGQYVSGHTRIGGVVFNDILSGTVGFGVTLGEIIFQVDGIWPVSIPVIRIDPNMKLTGRNPKNTGAGAIPLAGKPAVHADTEIWFRKRKNSAELEPKTSAVHTKVTLSGLATCENLGNASGQGNNVSSYDVSSVYDGTNSPITITTGIAYAPGF